MKLKELKSIDIVEKLKNLTIMWIDHSSTLVCWFLFMYYFASTLYDIDSVNLNLFSEDKFPWYNQHTLAWDYFPKLYEISPLQKIKKEWWERIYYFAKCYMIFCLIRESWQAIHFDRMIQTQQLLFDCLGVSFYVWFELTKTQMLESFKTSKT